MYNRRVVRGNTYAAQIVPSEPEMVETKKTYKKAPQGLRPPGTPDPVSGRRHIDVQTETYLEELKDTVPEVEMSTQTDAFMDRPPTPLFIPTKTGLDAATQIEAGDLFDFDFEVEPLLEVLIGKTLEQGLLEVCEEEELAAMRAHQEHFEQIRNAELVATQRMEAAEKRKVEEKERRLAQERTRVERENVVRQKVASSTFARGYLNGIMESVFDKLYHAGFFYDPVEKEVQDVFLPWLVQQAAGHMATKKASRAAVDRLIVDALKKSAEARTSADQARVAAADTAKAEAAKALEDEKAFKADLMQFGAQVLAGLGLEGEAVDEERAAVEAQLKEVAEAETAALAAAAAEGAEPQTVEPEAATDGQVVLALMKKGTVTKEAVVESLAALKAAPPAEGGAEAPAEGEAPAAEGEAPAEEAAE